MIITNYVDMDLQRPNTVAVVQVVQNDRYSRRIALNLYDGGAAWAIPEGVSAIIRYRKGNGKGGEYDTLPDGTLAWTAERNVLTVMLAPRVTTAVGTVSLSVLLMEGNEQIGTFSILLHVQASGWEIPDDSEDYCNVRGFLPVPAKAAVGQFFRVSAINERGQVTEVTAVDKQTLLNEDSEDEQLLLQTYTLVESDFIHGIWDGSRDAGSDVPFHLDGIGDKFCTRKFKVTAVPKISYCYFTDPVEYLFWNNGVFAGKKTWGEISADWSVDFEFDEVAVNFSWGWDSVGTQTIVRMSVMAARFEKVLVIGDSISADYYGNYDKWVTLLVNEGFFPAGTVNDSIHATGFVAEYTAEGDVDNNFVHRIQNVGDKDSFDLVVVFGGINDFIQGVPMGESGGDKTAAFVPAVEYFFSYLMNQFTKARIVVLTPLRTKELGTNTAGQVQTEYAEVIRQTAKNYCLPVLNLTEESGFCPYLESFRNQWTLVPAGYSEADGVHPNGEYQKLFLAPMIRGFLQQFARKEE